MKHREAQRDCKCRGCDKDILRGQKAIFMYSIRNRGQHIMLCDDCVEVIYNLMKESHDESETT